MRVLFFSPGFPAEMPFFVRGLGAVGAETIGVGDQPQAALPQMARDALAAYFQLDQMWDEGAVIAAVRQIHERAPLDRIECLWEPGMLLAARLREALGVPGMSRAQTVPFRDKEVMKKTLDDAGIRTPRHKRVDTPDGIRDAAATVGYPLIVKPIAGAGSADTHRVDGPSQLDAIIDAVRHVPEVSVEEFIEGEEFTYDTICSDGEVLFENVSWYRPPPLIGRTLEWVSPQTVSLRNLDGPEARAGLTLGRTVLAAFGFQTGFTHMEWFLKADGEAVFGEIGARPPGARSVDVMNYTCEADLFTGWAEAVVYGKITQNLERRFNCAIIYKRAQGEGNIQRVEGLHGLLSRYGPHVAGIELLPIGAPRRNWKQTLLSDGFVFVRHTDLQTTLAMADRVGTDLQIYAG